MDYGDHTYFTTLIFCKWCTKKFTDPKQYKCHLFKVHKVKHRKSESIKCQFCSMQFISVRSSRLHASIYHKEEYLKSKHLEFQCNFCLNYFKTSNELKRHLHNLHRNELPLPALHQCKICLEFFDKKYLLLQHTEQFHKYPPKRTINCAICGWKLVASISNYIEHLSIVHDTLVEVEQLSFNSITEFELWKADEQPYRKVNPNLYCCSHNLKANLDRDTHPNCPSRMRIEHESDGKVTLTYYRTHLGHSNLTQDSNDGEELSEPFDCDESTDDNDSSFGVDDFEPIDEPLDSSVAKEEDSQEDGPFHRMIKEVEEIFKQTIKDCTSNSNLTMETLLNLKKHAQFCRDIVQRPSPKRAKRVKIIKNVKMKK